MDAFVEKDSRLTENRDSANHVFQTDNNIETCACGATGQKGFSLKFSGCDFYGYVQIQRHVSKNSRARLSKRSSRLVFTPRTVPLFNQGMIFNWVSTLQWVPVFYGVFSLIEGISLTCLLLLISSLFSPLRINL